MQPRFVKNTPSASRGASPSCLLILAAALSAITACHRKTPEAVKIDRLVTSTPDPVLPEEVDDEVPYPPEEARGIRIERRRRLYVHNGVAYPILKARGEVYPGADIQGRSLLEGLLDPITAPRGAGTITILNNTGARSTVELAEVSLGKVSEAINTIVAAQPEQFPADFDLTYKRVRSREELGLAIDASADYWGMFDASASLDLRSAQQNSAVLVTLRQNFYSMAFERPSLPHQFYAPGTTLAELQPHIGPDNPATYIDQVDYGRVVYLLIQSFDELETLEAMVHANLLLGVAGGSLGLDFDYLTEMHSLDIRAYAYGGDAAATMQAIWNGLSNWNEFKASLATAAELHLAKPVSYSVRSMATDQMLKNSVTADYEYTVYRSLGAPKPELRTPESNSILDNGSGFAFDPVAWFFDWEESPHTDNYEIEVRRGGAGGDLVFRASTTNTHYAYSSTGARRSPGYQWRVRAHATWGAWQPWTSWCPFRLERPNTDTPHTGVVLFTHPNYQGGSITFEVLGSPQTINLENVSGWDDQIDSMRLTNCRVRLYEDPLEAPWHGGANRWFSASTPDVELQNFRRNEATVLVFDLGFPWSWLTE